MAKHHRFVSDSQRRAVFAKMNQRGLRNTGSCGPFCGSGHIRYQSMEESSPASDAHSDGDEPKTASEAFGRAGVVVLTEVGEFSKKLAVATGKIAAKTARVAAKVAKKGAEKAVEVGTDIGLELVETAAEVSTGFTKSVSGMAEEKKKERFKSKHPELIEKKDVPEVKAVTAPATPAPATPAPEIKA